MEAIIHSLQEIMHGLIELSAMALELVGVIIILGTAARTAVIAIKHKGKIGLTLGKGISLALEYLLASEVLHTLVAKDAGSLILVAMTMVLRAAMTMLIHWETHAEEKHIKEEEKEKAEKEEKEKQSAA